MRSSVGPSPQLSLRVSAATLSRIIFPHPQNNTLMLALEHKATVLPSSEKPLVIVKAQPFGGAVRILKTESLLQSIGAFSFDSERSRAEHDLRIFIHPSKWSALVAFLQREPLLSEESAFERDPARELTEEFAEALGFEITTEDYQTEHIGMVVEHEARPTSNQRAPGYATRRVYWIDEVQITNDKLCNMMLAAGLSVQDLSARALRDWEAGGRGRANAVFTCPMDKILRAYHDQTIAARRQPLEFEGVILSSNVPTILEGIDSPLFEWVAKTS